MKGSSKVPSRDGSALPSVRGMPGTALAHCTARMGKEAKVDLDRIDRSWHNNFDLDI